MGGMGLVRFAGGGGGVMQPLSILPQEFTLHQLTPGLPLPLMGNASFEALLCAADEITWVSESAVCDRAHRSDGGWRAIKIEAVMDFSVVGVMAKFSSVLAEANIALFALSTFNTDYILVKGDSLADAVVALKSAGYCFR